ncbi:ATP-grasp domain-containing protein [Moritella sp. 36]|uniref:ATP-grasp domain-containing protein n=1 Tax=Moritella sp. 36 TaxID=2746233 RepID=UPI001BA53CCF|nr:ATP-grasp domain-containing protein [Moritella sp. 36]QUM87858.1 ATP-grasp domain-containing protein [Moritella sp. 36]
MINVLIFPAGEINAIELHSSLSKCFNIKLYGASSVERHGEYVYENYISGLPFISDENFFYEFNKIIEELEIKLIFPTHDTIAEFLSKNESKIKCKVICAEKKTSELCRSKAMTYDLFSTYDFNPKVYHSLDNIKDINFPLFTKPSKGQGSVGATLVLNEEEAKDINLDENVLTEYLPGKEYTIDCFTSFNGELIIALPRLRMRTMAGVSVSGKTVPITEEIHAIAKSINENVKFNGLWFFQIKEDCFGKLKLLEISTRTAGTMCLSRAKGYNLPLLSVYNALEKNISLIDNNYEVEVDRTLINRFKLNVKYNNVYIDYDDTIIIRSKVNLDAIRYLYQLKNNNKNIFLITRHAGDIYESLKKYNIPVELFNSVLHLNPDDLKSGFIAEKESIFIDNSFQERNEVRVKLGIPVFDVDAIEVLLDWKC